MKPSRSPRFHASTCLVHTARTSATGSPVAGIEDAVQPMLMTKRTVADQIFMDRRMLPKFDATKRAGNRGDQGGRSTARHRQIKPQLSEDLSNALGVRMVRTQREQRRACRCPRR